MIGIAKWAISRLALTLGYRIESISAKQTTVMNMLTDGLGSRAKVNFLQVGAHDGTRNDPVARLRTNSGWSGVMVEVNPTLFAKLERNLMATPEVKAVNLALASTTGEVDFTFVRDPTETKCPAWADQISSLSRDYVIETLVGWGHTRNEAEQLTITRPVRCSTFEDLVIAEALYTLDLLVLDVEGMDGALLKLFPFHLVKPEWIVFESSHLTEFQRSEMPSFLVSNGYSFMEIGEDTVCRRWKTC